MKISKRLTQIKPSATLTINAKTQEMRAQGREVVSLAVGEPDFPTPPHVVEATKKAIDDGYTRYTAVPGLPPVREAIAGYYNSFYDAGASMEHTMCSNGGKQVLYNLFMALLEPGDEVLLPAPYWVSYPAMVMLADGQPVVVPSRAEDNFLVSVKALEAARTEKTRMLVLNTPSNPTGCHYSQAQLDEIADWARKNDIFIVSDEVYDRLVYAPATPNTLCGYWKKQPENVAVVGALSKSMCMTGFRFGFCLAHEDLIKALSKIQGQSTSNVNAATQIGAQAALTGPWDIMDEMNTAFVRRRDLALDIINSWPGASCPKPDGAFYVFPVLDAFFNEETPDSTSLCTKILEETGVALVPGAAFGDDRCLRFSYALDDETLAAALHKVGDCLMSK